MCFHKVVIFVYKNSDMLNKNTLGIKKCEANQKQRVSRQMRPKALISAEAKKLVKSGQVTKPIVKICYKLLYVILGVKSIFDEVTSWPQLISKLLVHFLPACTLLLIGLALFYTQGVFV